MVVVLLVVCWIWVGSLLNLMFGDVVGVLGGVMVCSSSFIGCG